MTTSIGDETSVLAQLKGMAIDDDPHGSNEKQSEDKKNTSSSSSSLALNKDDDNSHNNNENIEFVMVPWDARKPMKKMILPACYNTAGDSLPEFVKPYFADSRTVDVSLMKEQAQKTIASSTKQVRDVAKDTHSNITAASLNAIAAQGSVETFPLARPASTNEYCGVYMYMDELGMLKKLPLNSRASAFAQACGYPSPKFYGDVFLGRVQTKPNMANVSFVVDKDTDRGAEWMQRAPHENRAWHDTATEIQNEKRKIYLDSDKKEGNGDNDHNNDGEEAEMDWEQEEEELEIKIPFPNVDTIDKSKVKVAFLPKSIKIMYDGIDYLSIDPLWSSILAGDGCNTWTIEKPSTLVVTVEIADPSVAWPQLTL